jgi:hypothetical protein
MKVSGQLHARAALAPGKFLPVYGSTETEITLHKADFYIAVFPSYKS